MVLQHPPLLWQRSVKTYGHRRLEKHQHQSCALCRRQRKHLSKTSSEHTHQLAQWYNVLDSDPPNRNVVNFGWEVDYTNKSLITWQIPYAPEIF